MPGTPKTSDLFFNAFAHSSIGIALVGLDGSWLDVNNAICRILGYSKEDLLASTFQDITHPEDLQGDLNLVQKVIDGEIESYSLEKRYFHRSGSLVWCLLTVSLSKDESGKPEFFISQLIDITEQKKALEDRNAFFTLSPELLAIANNEGYLVQVNHAWTEALGWSEHELCSRPYIDFVHPEDLLSTSTEASTIARGRSAQDRFRNRYRHKDGSYRWLQWSTRAVTSEMLYCVVRDVTREVDYQEKIHSQDEKIRLLIEHANDAFVGMDEEGTITEWNKEAESSFGWSAQEAIGRSMAELLPPARFKQKHMDGMASFMRGGRTSALKKRVELPVRCRNGKEILAEMTIGSIKHNGRHHFHAFFRDVTEQRELASKLHYQATHDFLTGLPNRYEFMSRLQRAINSADRTKEIGGPVLLFIDLDGFKKINDTLGHEAGDAVLVEFGQRLEKEVRKTDCVARLAGDEFVILLEHVKQPRFDAEQIAQKVLAAARRPFEFAGKECRVSSSVGMAIYSAGDTADAILSKSDAAMYMSKNAGKNRVAFLDGDQWVIRLHA